MIKHKHCEVIKAWADGATVETRHPDTLLWVETERPTFNVMREYRVKPESVVDYTIVLLSGECANLYTNDKIELKNYFSSRIDGARQGLMKRTRIDGKVVALEFVKE